MTFDVFAGEGQPVNLSNPETDTIDQISLNAHGSFRSEFRIIVLGRTAVLI